jgi:hypothetical protein
MLKRIRIEKVQFITQVQLGKYCKFFDIDYDYAIRYYIRKGYFVRIFYVRSTSEVMLDVGKYNHMELVAKGLSLKSVNQWYFGLHTALKLNNMTHEYFSVEDIVNDKILRITPMLISGHKIKFTKISPSLFGFGTIRRKTRIPGTSIIYSDPERTILDFAYLWRYNSVSFDRIISDIQEWTENADRKKMHSYGKRYPNSIQNILEVIK